MHDWKALLYNVTAATVLAFLQRGLQVESRHLHTGGQSLTSPTSFGEVRVAQANLSNSDQTTFYSQSSNFEVANVPSKCDDMHSLAQRLIVVAAHKEEIDWLVTEVETPFLAYYAEARPGMNASIRTHSNGAKEASAYLHFIAEYYDCLPQVTAFVHAHRTSWHSHDMVDNLHKLNWTSVNSLGYMALDPEYFQAWGRYFEDHLADPMAHLQTQVDESDPDAGMPVDGIYYAKGEVYRFHQSREVALAWQDFFGPAGLGPLPSKVQYYCCAQFLVTAERIQRLPREFYLQAVHWTSHAMGSGWFPPVYTRSVVMETLWHIIFGQPAFLPRHSQSELCNHFHCGDHWES